MGKRGRPKGSKNKVLMETLDEELKQKQDTDNDLMSYTTVLEDNNECNSKIEIIRSKKTTIDFENLDREVKEEDIEDNKNEDGDKESDDEEDKAFEGVENLTDESIHDRRKTILTIQKYGNSLRFGKYLEKKKFNFNSEYLDKFNHEHLLKLLGDIRFTVSNKNSNSFVYTMSQNLYYGIDYGLNGMGVKAEGLYQTLCENQEQADLIEEIALECPSFTNLPLKYRIALNTMQIMSQVIGINTYKAWAEKQQQDDIEKIENINKKLDEPVDEKKYKEFLG